MKITDVHLTLFGWDDIPATTYGRHTGKFSGKSQLGLVTIETDEGVKGHAFLGSSMRGAHMDGQSLIQYLKPVVVNQDPLERERLYRAMWHKNRQTTYRAIGAMDVALWDIAGKVAGLPIYRLLGSYRESPTDPVVDADVCRAVRRAVGDGFTVMLDSTWAYQYPEALRMGKVVEELGFHWYEDPLADDDLLSYVKLKQHLSIPILATEYSPGGLTAFAPWLVHQATDYLRGDVAVKGGITALVKAAHLAEAFHMNFEIHHGGNSLNNVANLHVTMAIENCQFFEVLLPAGAQKYGLAEDVEVDKQGLVHAFKGPGLGAVIDFGLIERKKVAVLS